MKQQSLFDEDVVDVVETQTVGVQEVQSVQEEEPEKKAPRKKRVKSSQFKGVSFVKKTGRWMSFIYLGKDPETQQIMQKTIGNFKTEVEAATAYNNYITENNLPNKLNKV